MSDMIILLAWLWLLIFPQVEPCEHEYSEDQTVCSWNSSTQGNGEGRSFIKLGDVYWYTPGT